MKHAGFTLMEVLIAMIIFAMSFLALVHARTTAIRSVLESETLFKAVQLAQDKMNEIEFKYQKVVDTEGIKEGLANTDSGTFESPNDQFKWSSKLTESTLQISSEQLTKLMTDFGLDKDTAEQQVESQMLLLTNMNKMIKENYAELTVTIEWQQFGRKQSFPLVTHLIPTKPKIALTTEIEDAKE